MYQRHSQLRNSYQQMLYQRSVVHQQSTRHCEQHTKSLNMCWQLLQRNYHRNILPHSFYRR